MPPAKFDPLEPFASKALLEELLKALQGFEYKLFGKIPLKFHRGKPTKYEFDLDLGIIHFTEKDFRGLSDICGRINAKWGTQMTYCIYPSKKMDRHIILNWRGSPKAPSEID
jgi:hypothetical protein